MRQVLLSRINALLSHGGGALVAIDGGSASGKSTLAAQLAEMHPCTVFHMDDFFLPPQLRTPERLGQPGGNVHWERFAREVLMPVSKGEAVRYRPFDCTIMDFGPEISVRSEELVIVEGSYSMHPELAGLYDLKVFLSISPEEQRRRALARNGEGAGMFFEKWIPLENRYFDAFDIKGKSDVVIEIE